MDFMTLLTAVLTANLFTVLFLYGLVKAFKIGAGEPAPMTVVLAIAVPAGVVVIGALIAGAG